MKYVKNFVCLFLFAFYVVQSTCFQGFSYSEFMVTPQFAANNSIQTVASYNAPESEMGFAIAMFKTLDDDRPDYTNTPILLRGEEATRDVFVLSAKLIQICNLTSMECRYSKGYNTRLDFVIPTFLSYDISILPSAYYFTKIKQSNRCPSPSDLNYPVSLLSNASCVFFYNNIGYFSICSAGFAQRIPACDSGKLDYQDAQFCVSNSTTTSINPFTSNNNIGIQSGFYRSSHPSVLFVNVYGTGYDYSLSSSDRKSSFLF